MPFWQVSAELATTPAVIETTALEVRPLAFDATPLLTGVETVAAVTTQITDLTTNEVIGGGTATLAGNVATYTIKGLTAGHDYRVIWRIQISATKVLTRITIVRCVA